MFLVVDDLDEYFVPGGNGLLKGTWARATVQKSPKATTSMDFKIFMVYLFVIISG